MTVGQHETISVGPGRIVGVDDKELRPQDNRQIGHSHRHPGMARVGLLHGIHRQALDRVHRQLFDGNAHRYLLPKQARLRRPVRPTEQRMIRPVVLILISITLGISGLLLWRSALTDIGGFELTSDVALRQLGRLATTWKFWLGVFVLMGVVLISLELYGNEELSRIVPMYSMSYVLIALIGKFWLGENVTAMRWVGIIAILTGVGILVRT